MKHFIYLFTLIILFSCKKEHFNIDNPNKPTAEKVLANSLDLRNFNITNHTAAFYSQVGLSMVFPRGLADQFSTTNAYLDFWSFCDQPRRQVDNSTANNNLPSTVASPWNNFNEVIVNANIIINSIENEGNKIVVGDYDLTKTELATAYFDKGIAQGYISMIYDKGYIVSPDADPATLEFSTYSEILEASLSNIQKAIDLAATAPNFSYVLYPGATPIIKTIFTQLAYSYMARFSIGVARTDSEAAALNYDTILGYLNKGIILDFAPPSKEDVFYHNGQDWSLYKLGGGAGYMPTDIKIAHLFDPNYPTDYPTDTTILPAVTSTDPRTSYYEYVGGEFGFLRESRGRHLFSSYRHVRYFDDNNENQDGLPVQVFMRAEIDYMKAECYYRKGDYASAVAAFNTSPRLLVGLQTTTPAKDNVRNALLYEFSIELDLACGLATNWSFMRRHDLLQKGTPTSYPIPASELEITQSQIYTFGGESASGTAGTATGAKDWRNINLVY